MHQAIYETLIQTPKDQKVVSYSEIAPLAKLDMDNPDDRNRIAEILDEISRHEHAQGRPLLSAVVVHRGEGTPGKGFFSMARSVGVQKGKDDVTFFAHELTRVHRQWGGTA
jgi:hypothetical protein